MMVTIKVENLSCWYQHSTTPVLNDINLEISEGQFTCILGPSASGKTTLCFAMAGAIRRLFGGRVAGRVLIDGRNPDNLPMPEVARKVGLVFQDPESMFSSLRVSDEIAFGLENLCIDPCEMSARVERALANVGLQSFRNRYIHELSGGELQRLGIACVLAVDPEIVILDEPTSSIDPAGTNAFASVWQGLRRGSRTIVGTSKEWDNTVTMADQVIILVGGRVVAKGLPRDVLRTYRDKLMDWGIILPQVTELGLRFDRNGASYRTLPLDLKEALDLVGKRRIKKGTPKTDAESASKWNAVEFSNLSFQYPNGFLAINDISMQIPSSSICAFIGNNGAGKTTLAKLLSGLLLPRSGEILVNGESLQRYSRRSVSAGVYYVFQSPTHQFLAESVYDEVAIGLRVRGDSEHKIQSIVNTQLGRLGLMEVAGQHPLNISQSLQKLVALATGLALDPRIVIVDEPSHAQDAISKSNLLGLLLELKSEGKTVIVISHDMRFVESCADMISVLHGGTILFKGTCDQLYLKQEIMDRASITPPQLVQLTVSLNGQIREGFDFPIGAEEFLSRLEEASE